MIEHTFTWNTGRPLHNGEYIAIEKLYGHQVVAQWHTGLGWCIRGRWLGEDAVKKWTHLLPEA